MQTLVDDICKAMLKPDDAKTRDAVRDVLTLCDDLEKMTLEEQEALPSDQHRLATLTEMTIQWAAQLREVEFHASFVDRRGIVAWEMPRSYPEFRQRVHSLMSVLKSDGDPEGKLLALRDLAACLLILTACSWLSGGAGPPKP